MARPKTIGPKLFTLEEAQALLPLINDRLARGQDLLERFETVRKDLAVLRLVSASGGTPKNPDRGALSQKESEEAALVAEIRRVETELLDCGCVPKSVAEGLVDFFALKDGRLVFLCWKQGEEHIEAWHTLESGFAGRMPIASFLRGKAGE
jgi:hypothetical protein